jgi:acetyl esterase/lipase
MTGVQRWLAAGCTLLLSASLAGADEPQAPEALPKGVAVTRDLAYVPDGHARQKLDLYLPEQKPDAPLPVIVWIHGGAWRQDDKAPTPAVPFVTRRYALASINYRLSQDAKFPAQIHDCKAAIRWLRAHARDYDLDPERIGVWGISAGGHLAALLGTAGGVKSLEGTAGNLDQSSRVQAVSDWFGPIDFLHMGPSHDSFYSPESELLGGPVQENNQAAIRASPLTYLTKDAPPFLIEHGDKDDSVPIGQGEAFAAALQQAGVAVTFHRAKGLGHGGPEFFNAENVALLRKFFDEHLKKGAAN